VRRGYHPLVRVLRPEFGLLPHAFGRERVARVFWGLFADADAIDPSVVDVVVDEFRRIYGSAGARLAFLAAARNVYLDRPDGARGFYQRLSSLQPPALFVWGSHDRLIPHGFSRHVEKSLPGVEQIVIGECGHVPQVEHPQQTNGLLTRFFARADALDAPVRARAAA
jgi:pimeloyl-ACP methyl ester carboxylesterase